MAADYYNLIRPNNVCYICFLDGDSYERFVAHDDRHPICRKCLLIFLETQRSFETPCGVCRAPTNAANILTEAEKEHIQELNNLHLIISSLSYLIFKIVPVMGGIGGEMIGGPLGGIAGAAVGASLGNYIRHSTAGTVVRITNLATKTLSNLTGIRNATIQNTLGTGVSFTWLATVLYGFYYSTQTSYRILSSFDSGRAGQLIGGIFGGVLGNQYEIEDTTSHVLHRIYDQIRNGEGRDILARTLLGTMYGATLADAYLP